MSRDFFTFSKHNAFENIKIMFESKKGTLFLIIQRLKVYEIK